MTTLNGQIDEVIRIAPADSETLHYHSTATSAVGITPVPDVVLARPATVSEGIGTHAALVGSYGVVLLERIAIALTQVTNGKYHLVLTDVVRAASQLGVAVPVALTSGVGVSLSQRAVLSLQITEELGLLSTLGPTLLYHETISEALHVASSLAKFLAGDVVEAIHIAPLLAGVTLKTGSISEGIGVAAVANPQMILRVTIADTIDIAAADALNMIYSGTIAEGIEIAGAYLSPGDSVTTWAMNTRNGAVTEYQNYAFNSFAKLGNRYIAASDNGLYELLGDDDDGTDIVAQIKSGFAQWAGSKFTMFKGIYLGVRGGGDFVLRVTTGDDKTYNYAVSALDMQTTKVRTGKGLRARYFAFELISTGQDFDLDTIEFVPLIADRRV